MLLKKNITTTLLLWFMRYLFPIKKKKRKEKEHKRYVITINYEQQYRRYRFFFNAFPRERQPQEIVRQGQTLHRFETLWNFPNDKHQLSAKESAIFSSLRRENLTRFSIRNIYIYYHDNLDVAMSINDHSLVERIIEATRSIRHLDEPLLWSVVRGRISRDGNDSWGRERGDEPRGSFHPIAV